MKEAADPGSDNGFWQLIFGFEAVYRFIEVVLVRISLEGNLLGVQFGPQALILLTHEGFFERHFQRARKHS
ncbi:hypothetical protein D3C71_1740800 [compost metagenome]